jgi:hypothetical protein
MNIGDLVSDEWGYMAIIIAQVGVLDRWVIHYIESGNKSALFGSRLYPIRSKTVR